MSDKPNWNAIDYVQPLLSLHTKVQYEGRTAIVEIPEESCREALIYNIGDWMTELVGLHSGEDEEYDPTPWKKKSVKKKVPQEPIILNEYHLRGAESTKLSMQIDPYEDGHFCERACCRGNLTHALNTLVSLPALLLNPDRYTGDWWEQTDAQIMSRARYGDLTISYWGADNSILQHPALVSLIFGLFRQAVVLHKEGRLDGLAKAVPPAAVREALLHSDEKAALKLVQKAKPWLRCPTNQTYFPISGDGKWELFLNLHKALYQHGFEKVFGDVVSAWDLASRGIKALNGAHTYFKSKKNVANVQKLARKAA